MYGAAGTASARAEIDRLDAISAVAGKPGDLF
jgi:hypothetical protein